MNSKKHRRFKLIHFILILIAINAIIISFYRWTFSKPFDQSLWLAGINDIDSPTIRKRMLRDVRRNVLTPGTSLNEIVRTLGNSDTEDYFRGYDLVYWLGPDSSYIDSEWLVITLDEDNNLVETAILTD